MSKFLHRKCRSCGRWHAVVAKDTSPDHCPFCREPYGRMTLGMDVIDSYGSEAPHDSDVKRAK